MKVLLFSSDNSDRSGAFLSMCRLAKCLRENHNVDCRVILPRKGNGTRILDQFSVPYVIIRSYDWIIPINCGSILMNVIMKAKKYIKYFINTINQNKINKYIREFNPDIVHINTICGYVGAIGALKARKPLVWHIREFLEEDWGNKIYFHNNEQILLNKSSKVICVSQSVMQKFQKLINPEKMTVIYNGIDADRFYPNSNHRGEKVYIVCAGNMFPHKGQDVLIRAVKIVKEKSKKQFEIHLIGTGPKMSFLIDLVQKLELKDLVVFDGYKENVQDYFKKAHITVVPSVCEPFGRVTIEAMMSGSFVIGSDTGGTRELIGNDQFGKIFKCGNEVDLASKIIWAFDNPTEREAISIRAREHAIKEFSDVRNAENIFNVYNDIKRGI